MRLHQLAGAGEGQRLGSNTEWGSQQAKGQRDGQEDNLQDSVNGDADDAEREEQKPNEGIGDQGQQG
jgi:hypothetical protein